MAKPIEAIIVFASITLMSARVLTSKFHLTPDKKYKNMYLNDTIAN